MKTGSTARKLGARRSMNTLLLAGLFACACFWTSAFLKESCAEASEQPAADFQLEDLLGRSWTNECVSFTLSKRQSEHAAINHALVNSRGERVPYQVIAGPAGQPDRIEFLVSLSRFSRETYRFVDMPRAEESDLKVEEGARKLLIRNRMTGIEVRKTLRMGHGPISGFLLRSGKWACESRLKTNLRIENYQTSISARGPVFVELLCRARWADGSSWQARFRLNANEPVVLVHERFAISKKAQGEFRLKLGTGLNPDSLFYRWGAQTREGRTGKLDTWKIREDISPVFYLEPWLHWQAARRRGNWVGVYNEKTPDLLALAALNPGT